MVEHHPVIFTPEARRLVSAEGGMGGVLVIAVGPDPPGLDRVAQTVGGVAAPGPDARAIEAEIGRAHVGTPGTNAHLLCRRRPAERNRNTTIRTGDQSFRKEDTYSQHQTLIRTTT